MQAYTTVDAFKQCYFEEHNMVAATDYCIYTMRNGYGGISVTNQAMGLVHTPKDATWIREQDIPKEGTYMYSHKGQVYLEVTNDHYDDVNFFTFMQALVHDDKVMAMSLKEFIERAENWKLCTHEEIRFIRKKRKPFVYDPRDLLVNTANGKVYTYVELKDHFDPGIMEIACFAEDRSDDVSAPDMTWLDQYREQEPSLTWTNPDCTTTKWY